MNDTGRSFSWKEHVVAQENEQDTEGTASMRNGGISVMWANSQGGCDPLNRLLRNVEKSHKPPSQSPSSSITYLPSFSGAVTLVEKHSQASCSETSRSCTDSSGGALLSNCTSTSRPPKRTRYSLTRGSGKSQNGSASPSLSWISKSKLANPSRDALSRISRSLNQKMVSERTSSQQRMQQTQSSEQSSSQPHSLCTHVSPACLPKSGSLSRGTIVQRQPDVLQSAYPVRKRGTKHPSLSVQAERQAPTIANSPRKARIKALLETIDHAGPFPGQIASSNSSTTPDGHKLVNSSRFAIQKDREQENQLHPSQLRKALTLGLPRALPVQPPQSSSLPHTSNVVFKPPSLPSPVADSVGLLQTATNYPLHADPSHPSDLRQMRNIHTTRIGNETWASQETVRRQSRTKGYRSSDSYSTPLYGSGSPSGSDDNLETVLGDDCDLALIPRSTRLCADTGTLSLTPRIISIPGDDVEVNVSSDGASSSSYGDIDIDPLALEDACKAYDT